MSIRVSPFDMDEVVWDYQVFAVPDSPEIEVGIFAIRRDRVRKYLSVFVDRKIEPVIVQASPLSLYNFLAFDDMPEGNAVVILDEAQNATAAQMKMFLTRLGAGSRAIVTGDVTQTDLPRHAESGLVQARDILMGIEGIEFVTFDKGDVVRHRLVKEIIEAYERMEDEVSGDGR